MAWLSGVLALGGCDGGSGGVEPGTDGGLSAQLSMREDIQPIFDRSCVSSACHGGDEPQAGLSLARGRGHAALVDASSTLVDGETLVIPGDPDGSLLVRLLRGPVPRDPPSADGPVERMPPGRATISAADVARIEDWVAAGAPE